MRSALVIVLACVVVAGAAAHGNATCRGVCVTVGTSARPPLIRTTVGTQVTFRNRDGVTRRLTAPGFFSVTLAGKGRTAAVDLPAGTFAYRVSGAAGGTVLVKPYLQSHGAKVTVTWATKKTIGTRFKVWARGKVWRASTRERSAVFTIPAGVVRPCFAAAASTGGAFSAVSPASCVGAPTGGSGSGGGKTPAPASYTSAVTADHPVAFWRFATGADDSVGGAGLTLTGGAGVGGPGVEGASDHALQLSGDGQYATHDFASSLNPATFTAEAWAKVTGGAGTARKVITERDGTPKTAKQGFIIEATADDIWKVWFGRGIINWGFINGPAVVLNKWTHLVAEYDGKQTHFYVDGVQMDAQDTLFAPNAASPLKIGVGQQADGSPGFFFPGAIDDVAIYPRALPAARVAAHFRAASL